MPQRLETEHEKALKKTYEQERKSHLKSKIDKIQRTANNKKCVKNTE